MKQCLVLILFCIFPFVVNSQNFTLTEASSFEDWPTDLPWWKQNNLRVMQTNLPAYEAQLNVDHLIEDLQKFSVNTLIINGGGIMAFYPTKLDFQYTNPYMQPDMLRDIIKRCHEINIRVITRFDFSRMHKSIFDAHPDWCYISAKGERIINDDMYVASINAPYVQEKSIAIVEDLMDHLDIDGIFINMPGYATKNAYEGTYHGIDQNEHDKARFKKFSGFDLPLEEDIDDPVFRKYQEFKSFTADEWIKNIHNAVKAKNTNVAICTYMEKYVDIIRHESQTNALPYWPYMSYDNVTNTLHSQPDHIVSNASIQQMSFRSRFNAIEPEETAIRLWENIAAGSGLDMSMMGDFRNYEDKRNFNTWERIYAFHKKYEPYYGKYTSPAEICIISPSYWPGGSIGQEYRGIQLMLKEAHIQYDIVEHNEIGNLSEQMKSYKVIIIPDIKELNKSSIETIQIACQNGTAIIGTNQVLTRQNQKLLELFGAKLERLFEDGHGHYISPLNKSVFTRFEDQTLLFTKFNLSLYDFKYADKTYLPIYSPGRPGPPEKIGGHELTGNFALGIKTHSKGKAALLPWNIGRLYYLHGYEQHKNIFLDVLEELYSSASDLIETNAHPRVEMILQNFIENIPANIGKSQTEGMILHLVNLTGYSGNTYFKPLPVNDINISIKSSFKPTSVFSLVKRQAIPYDYIDGRVSFTLDSLEEYDGVILNK